MHRFTGSCFALVLSTLLLTPLTGSAAVPSSVAVYAGTEKITSIGGGNSNSVGTVTNNGSATGKRRQAVYIAIDSVSGQVQRVRVNARAKTFSVESAVQFNQVFPETGGLHSKQFVRLMLLNHTSPQPGEFTDTASQYDGRTSDSVIESAGLTFAYPRVLKWSFDFQYSGFVVDPPSTTTYPQIDTGKALLSLNKNITKQAVGKTLADTMNIIRGVLRHYTEEP